MCVCEECFRHIGNLNKTYIYIYNTCICHHDTWYIYCIYIWIQICKYYIHIYMCVSDCMILNIGCNPLALFFSFPDMIPRPVGPSNQVPEQLKQWLYAAPLLLAVHHPCCHHVGGLIQSISHLSNFRSSQRLPLRNFSLSLSICLYRNMCIYIYIFVT